MIKLKRLILENIKHLESQLKSEFNLRSLNLSETSDGDIYISMIAVDKSQLGQGIGTKVMNKIINYADKVGKRIVLTPGKTDKSFGTTSQTRLIDFYKRFGFILNKGRNKDFSISELMYRNPR